MRQVDIKGFEDYQVTDDGRIWSKKSNMFLEQRLDKDGYPRISIHKDGKVDTLKVHQLVAEAFIPNPENKPIVGHLKKLPNGLEDKTANEVWNLAWMTYAENNTYGTRIERVREKVRGQKRPHISEIMKNRIDESTPVCQYTTDGVFIAEFPSLAEVSRQFAVSKQAIFNCCNGKSKTSCGYVWKYKNDQPN